MIIAPIEKSVDPVSYENNNIRYIVLGETVASVTYRNSTGLLVTEEKQLPFEYSYFVEDGYLAISVQAKEDNLACQILVGENSVVEDYSAGENAVVSCSYLLD